MLTRLTRAGLLWPTVLTSAGLAILVSLGTWQMRRLAWKEALIAKVEARATQQPVSLRQILNDLKAAPDEGIANHEFRRVQVAGRFLHDKEFHVWSPGKRGPAWSVVTPLELFGSELGADTQRYPLTMILVIRGVVADAQKRPAERGGGNPDGDVDFVGRVRGGRVGVFSSTESADKNEWYEYDIDRMRSSVARAFTQGSASGTPEEAMSIVAPFFIEAVTPTGGAAGPQPNLGGVNLTNRHLEYALTWYGLALTLFGVYIAFAWSRLRQRV